MLDYLGHYTRMLKYDAVPNLYLPNPHTSVIIKASIDQTDVVNTEGIATNQMKEMIVYEVQNVTDPNTTPNFEQNQLKDYIEIASNYTDDNQIGQQIKEEIQENQFNNEKYRHITNKQELEKLKDQNVILRQSVKQLEAHLKKLKSDVVYESAVLSSKDKALAEATEQYESLRRASMSMADEKNILSKVFSESQIKILSGKKKIYWSNDDMAIGYTIRHLSNKRCYMYLSKKLNIPLPALSSIKRWSTLKKHEFEKQQKKDHKFEEKSE